MKLSRRAVARAACATLLAPLTSWATSRPTRPKRFIAETRITRVDYDTKTITFSSVRIEIPDPMPTRWTKIGEDWWCEVNGWVCRICRSPLQLTTDGRMYHDALVYNPETLLVRGESTWNTRLEDAMTYCADVTLGVTGDEYRG